jgi:hypothetical protein
VVWRLCWSEPRLVLLGLRGLLTHNAPAMRFNAHSEGAAVTAVTPGD